MRPRGVAILACSLTSEGWGEEGWPVGENWNWFIHRYWVEAGMMSLRWLGLGILGACNVVDLGGLRSTSLQVKL